MFAYNPGMGIQMPNLQEDFLRGQEFAAKKQEWEAQNALRSAMGQYGAAAAEGDQNALRELAKYDPQYALGMMDTRQGMDMRTRQDTRQAEAHSSGLKLDQARLDQIREQSRTAASEHSLKMDETTRARELEETNRVGSAMSMAWQKGPEEFARFMGSEQMKDAPPELRGLSYEDAPYGIAMLGGAAEGFQAPAAPEPIQLGANERLIDPTTHQELVGAAPSPAEAPSAVREYEFAVKNGYKGSFEQWKKDTSGGTTVNVGGESANLPKPPSGFINVPQPDGSFIQAPIEGGPGTQVSGEISGRIALAEDSLKQLPKLIEMAEEGKLTGLIDRGAGWMGWGEQGEARRENMAGSEAITRMLTGAGMNAEEAAREVELYIVGPWDTAASAASKLKQLQRRLEGLVETANRGRAGAVAVDPETGLGVPAASEDTESIDDLLGRY